jgi:hypothetical protein
MKSRNCAAVAAALLIGVFGQLGQRAVAEMLCADGDRQAGMGYGNQLESQTLYEATTFVRGSALTYTTLQIETAGTLLVKLVDLTWPQAFESLSFTLANAAGVLGTAEGSGLMTFQLAGPVTLFAGVYADAAGLKDKGLYHLAIDFAPSVVPLPAAVWLLLSGLGGLAMARRRRAAALA